MNGAEHYREAERLLDHAEEGAFANSQQWYANAVAAAHVHATLASIPESQIVIYQAIQERLVERLTEDRCLDAFRAAWVEADLEGKDGDRVRSGMVAAIRAALL